MKIVTSVRDMQSAIKEERRKNKSIGLVPTMGYLHEGHRALMEKARQENDIVVVSVFVNPLQFGPTEDLDSYPRDFDRDQKAANDEGVNYVFYPSVEEMYPNEPSVRVTVKDRTDVLCGKSRPGHFDGVATVLTKLFHITLPDRAYFGLKDAQQVAVIDSLVRDFNFPIEIVAVNTVREADGLAKSSRNIYLTPDEREKAPILNQSLQDARKLIEEGERNPEKIISIIREIIEDNTKASIDYIEIYSYPELKSLNELSGKIIIALAVRFSKARLIDNIVLTIS
ncbi:pantoate--beta-alanine ligase [Bacillus massilinigeriensis]|uniref:pantoate--beta-alanine ligase n=1 Tax=Bacillus massilionigeriensis TaxID=1805475 RepID=UPI00096B4322|nr:pantoate--beta-alanine ligase [Bacillus massilionigeriensis]